MLFHLDTTAQCKVHCRCASKAKLRSSQIAPGDNMRRLRVLPADRHASHSHCRSDQAIRHHHQQMSQRKRPRRAEPTRISSGRRSKLHNSTLRCPTHPSKHGADGNLPQEPLVNVCFGTSAAPRRWFHHQCTRVDTAVGTPKIE